jgi:hypothetical protein
MPERRLRSQKIQRHPGDSARAPPTMGPMAVAMFGLHNQSALLINTGITKLDSNNRKEYRQHKL